MDRLHAAPDPQIHHPSRHAAGAGPVECRRCLQRALDRSSIGFGGCRSDLSGDLDHPAVRHAAEPFRVGDYARCHGCHLRLAQEQPSEASPVPADPDLRNRRQGRFAGDPAPELAGVSGRRLPDLR